MTSFAYEMELEGISFNLDFVRISWGIFVLLLSSPRLDAEGSGGPSTWHIHKLKEAGIPK